MAEDQVLLPFLYRRQDVAWAQQYLQVGWPLEDMGLGWGMARTLLYWGIVTLHVETSPPLPPSHPPPKTLRQIL